VILYHGRRRLATVNVTSNPTAERIARQVTEAFPWDETPGHLVRDRAFVRAYTRRIHAMGIRVHPSFKSIPDEEGTEIRILPAHRGNSLTRTGHPRFSGARGDRPWAAHVWQFRASLQRIGNVGDWLADVPVI
jgi:hypothetical protein